VGRRSIQVAVARVVGLHQHGHVLRLPAAREVAHPGAASDMSATIQNTEPKATIDR